MSESTGLLPFARRYALAIAGVAGFAVFGYAVYMDYKRRSAPDYKDNVRQGRREEAKLDVLEVESNPDVDLSGKRGDRQVDPKDVETLFHRETQLGQHFMEAGNIEQGAFHLANAAALFDDPRDMLMLFHHTLPPDDFQLILQMMPEARKRVEKLVAMAALEAMNSSSPTPAASTAADLGLGLDMVD